MAILKEIKPKFAIRQVAQGAPYFDTLKGQGLAKGFELKKNGKGKIIIIFQEDKGHIPRCLPKLWQTGSLKRDCRMDKADMKELKTGKALTSNMFVINMFTNSIKIGFQILKVIHKYMY